MRVFTILCLVLAAPTALASEIVEGRVIVKLDAEAAARARTLPEDALPRGLAELDKARESLGIADGFRVIRKRGAPMGDPQLFREIGLDRLYVLEVPGADEAGIRALVEKLSRQSWIEYAEPDYKARLTTTVPNDPRFAEQWAHNNVGQSGGTSDADMDSIEAWDLGTGNASAIVAILDTGVDLDHPDLVTSLLAGYDTFNNDPDPEDDHGHGTACAGIAAAKGNNSISVAGICWNCSILPVKVCGSLGQCSTVPVADGIVFAADNGADAISMSLGVFWSQALTDATNYAAGLGALCFGSAGNLGTYTGFAPSDLPACVSVGGSGDDDARIFNYGDHQEVSAPTGVLTTAMGGGDLEDFGGTSASCPHAAGLAALLRATDPELHVNELRYLLRVGADDGVGIPAEDTPGWDQYMGYGRINSNNSMSLINGPWLALDRPHYVCGGDLGVALKDETAGATATVTLSGSIGGDMETVIVNPLTADGYYEGTIPISWAGVDGPVVVGDGKIDVQDGEIVSAVNGSLSASAFLDCFKRVCFTAISSASISGDCDGDRSADPGEIWQLDSIVRNLQTEEFTDVVVGLESTDPSVIVVGPGTTLASLPPEGALDSDQAVSFGTAALGFHVSDTAAALGTTALSVSIAGPGWKSDTAACGAAGFPALLDLPLNRDLGPALAGWNFDDGSSMGWTHDAAHGSGDLAECNAVIWGDDWDDLPATDRAHSGTHAMRLGNGAVYDPNQDAGLASPPFPVPAGGGAIGFRLWIDTELSAPPIAWDGLVVEAKPRFGTTWTYMADATYNTVLNQRGCGGSRSFPFGAGQRVGMFGGAGGAEPAIDGDAFDVEHVVNLSSFADQQASVRFRLGADSFNGNPVEVGVWVDTVTRYGPFTADAWSALAPANASGSDANCPASYDLSWDAVAGAADYAVYRSLVSCADAQQQNTELGTSVTTQFADTTAQDNVPYFYAVGAREAGTSCGSERACVSGGCVCALAADANALHVGRSGNDLLLNWADPSTPGISWNVYRDGAPDPAAWGGPHAAGVLDGDPGTPGIQYVDAGAVSAGSTLYYLLTVVNACGETPLR